MLYHERQERARRNRKWIAGAVILLLLLLLLLIILFSFRVKESEVVGNHYYTEKEIRDKVIHEGYAENTLLLYGKYKYLGGETIPFVDKIEIKMLSNSKVSIRVYEKSMIGFVQYMGTNIYFDKDGTVVESSSGLRDDVPLVIGLDYSNVSLNQPLNVPNPDVFGEITSLTQLLAKNELHADGIEFRKNGEIYLHFADVRVNIGRGDALQEKMSRLGQFLEQLEGKSGVLHMESFTEDSNLVSFKEDPKKAEEATPAEEESEEGEAEEEELTQGD